MLFDRILIQFFTKPFTLPQIEITVDHSLGFTVFLYGWFLPVTHLLYYNYRRSIRNVNIIELVTKIKSYSFAKESVVLIIQTVKSLDIQFLNFTTHYSMKLFYLVVMKFTAMQIAHYSLIKQKFGRYVIVLKN